MVDKLKENGIIYLKVKFGVSSGNVKAYESIVIPIIKSQVDLEQSEEEIKNQISAICVDKIIKKMDWSYELSTGVEDYDLCEVLYGCR